MTQNQESSKPEVGAVSLHLAAFWPKDPIIWFAKSEAQFRARSITSEQNKFDYLVQSLNGEVASQVRDLLEITPTENPYTISKEWLSDIFTLTEPARANRLMSVKSLGDRKPSELLSEIRNLAGRNGLCLKTKHFDKFWQKKCPSTNQLLKLL